MTLLSIGVILAFGAVNHPDMHWDERELCYSKNMARGVTMLWGGVIISYFYLDLFPHYAFYIAEGIWVSALSILIAKI